MRGSTVGRCLIAATLLVAFASAGAASAEPTDQFEAEAQRVLQDSSLQGSNPDRLNLERAARKPEAEAEAEAVSRRRNNDGAVTGERPRGTTVPGAAVSLGSLVFWVLIALLAVALLAVLWRGASEQWALRGGKTGPRGDDEARLSSTGSTTTRRSWQELAAQGRYSDAVHCLLLEALKRLDVAARQGRALTSREVLLRARLNPERRAALEELILTVERSLFGGTALEAGDYERCLSAFQRFGYG